MSRKYLGQLLLSVWFSVAIIFTAYADTNAEWAQKKMMLAQKNVARTSGSLRQQTSPSSTNVSTNQATSTTEPNDDALPSLEAFRTLDEETELLLKEVLNLSSDLAILEEDQNNPAKFQLLVLVTMAPTKLFNLDYMELKIDNQTVAAYNYTHTDGRALQLGGGHRLYLANLPAGMHKLSATMAGHIPRDPDYKKSVNFNFISGVARTVLELSVDSAKTNGFPNLNVLEWN